jgi:protein-S-isoprenylcysteine O-methyltransferase Ste14
LPEKRSGKRIIQVAGSATLWFGALFGGAGTVHWVRGWVYAAVYVAGMATIGIIVRRRNPELLAARAKWRRPDTKPFDRVFLSIYLPLTYIQPAVAGMDVVRFGWSSMPLWWIYPGCGLLALSLALIAWTMVVNRHAETTVRIQKDRGHTVIDRGPYHFVRHPMYVGAILMHASSAVILGSYGALIVAGIIAILFVGRTALEDRTLRRELPGYEEFAGKTKYRLLPPVW